MRKGRARNLVRQESQRAGGLGRETAGSCLAHDAPANLEPSSSMWGESEHERVNLLKLAILSA